MIKKTVHRDAVTGEFVTEEYAKDNPTTTIRQRIRVNDDDEDKRSEDSKEDSRD